MPNITKQDLVTDIAVATGISQKHTKIVINGFFDFLVFHLNRGDSIELRGFGTFSVKSRKGRPVRNPRTGQEYQLADRIVPTLKFCDRIKDAIVKHIPEKS